MCECVCPTGYLSLCTRSEEFVQWLTGREAYKSLGSDEPVHLPMHSVVPVLDTTQPVFHTHCSGLMKVFIYQRNTFVIGDGQFCAQICLTGHISEEYNVRMDIKS